MKPELLFRCVVIPLGLIGRPWWRRRVELGIDPGARTYWRKRGDTITEASLRTKP